MSKGLSFFNGPQSTVDRPQPARFSNKLLDLQRALPWTVDRRLWTLFTLHPDFAHISGNSPFVYFIFCCLQMFVMLLMFMINKSLWVGLLLAATSGQAMAQEKETRATTGRSSIGRKLDLAQNFPDPVARHEQTVIRYSAIDAYERFIIVNDAEGNRVMTFSDLKPEGEIRIDAGRLAPGTYKYALVVNGRVVERKKMVVL